MDDGVPLCRDRRPHLRIRLPRRQLRHDRHHGRRQSDGEKVAQTSVCASVPTSPIVFPSEQGDDPSFLDLVRLLIAAELKSLAPPEFFVIRIDNWIDEKWLGFSGLGRVEFPWRVPWQDTALDEFRDCKHPTFP